MGALIAPLAAPFIVGGLVLGLAIASPEARAARVATVESDEVDLREKPMDTAKSVDRLKKGDMLTVSNVAVNGFYKVRTGLGIIGFVEANSVALVPVAAPPVDPDAPTLPTDPALAAPVAPPETPTPRARNSDRGPKHIMRLKALGGYNFYSVSDVNTLLSSEVLKYGFNFGAEAQVLATSRFTITVRFERIQGGVFARDSAQAHVYQIDTGAWTALGGLGITLASGPRLSVHIGALAGVGLSSTISATDLSSNAPNVTTMSSMSFAGLAKLDVHWLVTGPLGFFIEGGYRLQKSPLMQPADSPNGSQIFKDQTTGVYVPVSLNYSGPFVGGGISVSF